MSKFAPTPEQDKAVAAALTGENLVMTAGAGSGKTSTLRLIADALAPKRGTYVAYNKAIQLDAAASFPANVSCRTAHSLAYGAVGKHYKQKLNAQRMKPKQMARALDIESAFKLTEPDENGDFRKLMPSKLASLVMQTVGKFCHTADRKIGPQHAPSDIPGTEEVSFELASFLAERAAFAWEHDLTPRDRGSLPFSHDMYVKIWALGNPRIPGDFILYDEAQDADPCIAGVILAQTHSQLIAVGDECQAIYGWRGATDAMKNWPAKHRVALTKSFRFGQAIADEANVFLGLLDAPLRIQGFEAIDSKVGPLEQTSAVLCRTNGAIIENALNLPPSQTFAIVGGTDQIEKFADAALAIMEDRRDYAGNPAWAWHPDLGVFTDWQDVLDYVQDGDGSDIRVLVNMIDRYGLESIFDVCRRAVPEDRADVVLSTAHKSKGREWDYVRIGADFSPPDDAAEDRELSRPELMLMYVAVTRAKLGLDASALAWAKVA